MTHLRLGLVATALVAIGLAGCGDNSAACGAGTKVDAHGFCVPDGTGNPVMCTDGTRLDPATNSCQIDPASCQGGTVLIGNACQDPTVGLAVDVEEGPEPNGLGLGDEDSSTPAGTAPIKALGARTIIHGHLTPRADRDDDGLPEGDFDTYLIDVSAPTLLQMTADGVNGVSAGFVAVSASDALASWRRLGVNLTGDTTKRALFLPAAGRYAVAVADSRSLVLGSAIGDPTSQYYLTIEQLAIPTPTPITLTGNRGTATGTLADQGDIQFFTAPMGLGLDDVSLETDAFIPDVTASLVIDVDDTFHALRDEDKAATSAAQLTLGGLSPTTTLLVVDQRLNTTTAPVAFTLAVKTRDAVALPTAGTSASQPNPTDVATSFDSLTAWYFDATAAGQVLGLDLSWSSGVDGFLVDEAGTIVNFYSWDLTAFVNGFTLFDGFVGNSWSAYKGLYRAPAPGRYYFLVYNPHDAGGTLQATSTITALTPMPLAFATAITAVAPNAFNSTPFDYAGTEPWQRFSAGATTASGGADATFFDASTAFGRVDPVVVSSFGGAVLPGFSADDLSPIVHVAAPGNGSAAVGHLMPGQPDHLFAKVTTASAAGTFDLLVDKRTYIDEGAHDGPFTHTDAGQALDPTSATTLRYLIKTEATGKVTVLVHPTTATLDLQLAALRPDESGTPTDATGAGGDETITVTPTNGYVAVEVSSAVGPATGSFDITFTVVAPYYTVHAGTTAWSNICPSGTVVPLVGVGGGPPDDDALSAAITIPAFPFFGASKTSIQISSNGWFSFVTGQTSSRPGRLEFTRGAPAGFVAPFWDDLFHVTVCTKVSGTRLTIQWRGLRFDDPTKTIASQAILDTSDGSIELVYAPYLEDDGSHGSAGAANTTTSGVDLWFQTASVTPGTSVRLTHP